MIGGMPLLIQSSVRELANDTIEEGDVIVHNDPYRGGLHTPEHTFFKPVFVEGELMGYAVSIGHVSEIGGIGARQLLPARRRRSFTRACACRR